VDKKLIGNRPALKEMRRMISREEWTIENQAAITERCRLLESEGGTAAERVYGDLIYLD
jgi:post-segregation antitoxin (ccd killing protein)